MDLGNGLGHLTYSTLVHPADDWEQIWQSLNTYVPKVKERFAGNQRFGVSLRLSAKSAQALVSSTEERTRYTMNVASVVADIAPKDVLPSIQTSPLGFKPRVTGPDVVDSYTTNVLRVARHLVELEAKTGVTVTLGLEPEPYCFLETTDETVDYFTNHLYAGKSVEKFAKMSGLPIAEAMVALRRHVGIVYDICHLAVEYEDITQSLQKLVDAGVPIVKLQEAAALHIPDVTPAAVDALKRYSKTIYLTQTIEKKDGKLTKYLNVDDAIAEWEKNPGPREWRTHIHVPVFLDDLGQFRTTRFAIADALKFHKQMPLSRHLEVETYTWDMLPENLKTGDIVEYVCRELEWVRGQLV